MALVDHTPDPTQGALVDAAGVIPLPDDNEVLSGDTIAMPDAQIIDWIAFLTKGPANDIDFKITGNGTPPAAGYTPLTNAIIIKGTGITMSASPLAFTGAASFVLGMTQPASAADPGVNTFTGANVSKAWGKIETDGAGSYTVLDGINIASCTVTSTYIEVTWARVFANDDYAPVITCGLGLGATIFVAVVDYANQTTAKTRIYVHEVTTNVSVDPAANVVRLGIDVKGRH